MLSESEMSSRSLRLRGFKDYLPQEMFLRRHIVETLREVFESYGFEPLATPALERESVLLGYGEEASKQIYRFEDPDGVRVGLRYDLTVPLCRFVLSHPDLVLPFRRYQVQSVWRYDKPDPGRFREFLQFDIDTVGASSVAADGETIAAMAQALRRLKVPFRIRFSNRKILNGLIRYAGVATELAHSVFRVIDKLERIGFERVLKQLGKGYVDDSGARIEGLGLETAQIEKIERFLSVGGGKREEVISALAELLEGIAEAEEGIEELREVSAVLSALGVGEEEAVVDPTIARGLDYYTGVVYEAQVVGGERFGSVMGGGRYDGLIKALGGGDLPATGASVGVDRLAFVVETLGLWRRRKTVSDVLITVMMPDRLADYMRLADELRRAGLCVEVYMGGSRAIGKQLRYADRKGVRFAVIVGEDEWSQDVVSVKDLRAGEEAAEKIKEREEWLKRRAGQITIPRRDLAAWLKQRLQK